MFRPKKYLKLDLLKSTPSINDLKEVLVHAEKLRGCTIELPWYLEKTQSTFALAVRLELGSNETFWTLYEGAGEKSHVLWHAPFTDLSLLKEVIGLSITDIIDPDNTSTPKSNTSAKTPSDNEQTAKPSASVPHSHPLMENTSAGSQSAPVPSTIPYGYFYPNYSYPQPVYPPVISPGQMANSVPMQPINPLLDPNASSSRLPAPDIELLRKQTNHRMGLFLVDTGLLRESTLKAALKLQEMVVGNVISEQQAYQSLQKLHQEGGNLDIAQLINNSPTSGNTANAPKQTNLLLGDLLINANVLNKNTLEAVLKMQEIVRAGALSKDEACQAISNELIKMAPAKNQKAKSNPAQELRVIDLLIKCSQIAVEDKETAQSVQEKHGGQLGDILIAAGKLHKKTFAVAIECESLVFQKKLKLEQAIITLNYCARSRVNLKDALIELGFHTEQ